MAEWRPVDWEKEDLPGCPRDYAVFEHLWHNDEVVGSVMAFSSNPMVFYANVEGKRSGAMGTLDWAKQWAGHESGVMRN